MRATTANVRADHAAWKLGQQLAPRITDALHHIGQQLSHLDGYSAGGSYDDSPRSTNELTPVERIANARFTLTMQREQIRDDLDAVCQLIDALGHTLDQALRTHAPTIPADEQPRRSCSEAQMGRDGVIEWGNALCTRWPDKVGLCNACYQRERRWRAEHSLTERASA